MIRTLLVPDNQDVSIQLPQSFIGKQVEVIAFTINDSVSKSQTQDKSLTYYATQNVLAKDWLTSEEDEAWQSL